MFAVFGSFAFITLFSSVLLGRLVLIYPMDGRITMLDNFFVSIIGALNGFGSVVSCLFFCFLFAVCRRLYIWKRRLIENCVTYFRSTFYGSLRKRSFPLERLYTALCNVVQMFQLVQSGYTFLYGLPFPSQQKANYATESGLWVGPHLKANAAGPARVFCGDRYGARSNGTIVYMSGLFDAIFRHHRRNSYTTTLG